MVIVDVIEDVVMSMWQQGTAVKVGNDITFTPSVSDCSKIVYNCDACFTPTEDGEYSYYEMRPFYEYGNKNEIERILSSKKNETKYPLIILEQPFTEEPNQEFNKMTLRFLIVKGTENADKLTYRERYEENFKKTLYPIYDKFLRQLEIACDNVVVKSKIDRPFYGEKNLVASDYWDAIDLKVTIELFNKYCKINKICKQ